MGLLLAWLDFAIILSGMAASVTISFWDDDKALDFIEGAMGRFQDSLDLFDLPDVVLSAYGEAMALFHFR